jgi:hypothetical protein
MLEKTITLETGDRAYVLSASLGALRSICERWPKMEDAIGDLRGLSLSACSYIVSAATGLKLAEAEAVVFGAGLAKSTAACVELLAVLINPEGDDAEGAKPGNP